MSYKGTKPRPYRFGETVPCKGCGLPIPAAQQRVYHSRECYLTHHERPWLLELNATGWPAEVARRTAKQRGDAIRAKHDGTRKSYPKLNGKHAHRTVMEEKLGRPLTSSEIVHHRNENRQDYSDENLIIITRSEHIRHHLHQTDVRLTPEGGN